MIETRTRLYANEVIKAPQYKAYTQKTFKKIPQIENLPEHRLRAMEVVGNVLPFKTNSYVVNELIDWDNIPDDPMFVLTFPQREMLRTPHFAKMEEAMMQNGDGPGIANVAHEIRMGLNPHPAGQSKNVPIHNGQRLTGMQHKYRETVLFFPSQSQTCHAYCTFCFRWPQFVGMNDLKFAMKEVNLLIDYVRDHPEVTDILFTGGDPMIMKAKHMSLYLNAILDADIPHLKTIRIGTKSLSFWPYKYVTDPEADDFLRLFEQVVQSGLHLALMAHFSHPRELSTNIVREAIRRIRNTGAEIRTQSPLLAHINDSAEIWARMWQQQVNLGLVPYYMFVARDTGAQHYFGVPLTEAWQLFQRAYQQVSGVCRTVRGPSMSANPGKIEVVGPARIDDEKVLVLRMLQGRNPDWVLRPFFAEYDEQAIWLDDLQPAFGKEEFFFEAQMRQPR